MGNKGREGLPFLRDFPTSLRKKAAPEAEQSK